MFTLKKKGTDQVGVLMKLSPKATKEKPNNQIGILFETYIHLQ